MKNSHNLMQKLLICMALLFGVFTASFSQIVYSGNNLNIGGSTKHPLFNLNVENMLGLYWHFYSNKFFQLDVSPQNPRIAGSGDCIAFYNTTTRTFNSIQVSDVLNLSDSKAKDNIQSLQCGLQAISQIRPVSYTWKQNKDTVAINRKFNGISKDSIGMAYGPTNENERLHYGFLAQELEKVLPSVVKTGEDGNKMVSYMSLIPILVQAVQELNSKVEEQSLIIEQMKNQSNSRNAYMDNPYKIVSCSPVPAVNQVTITYSLDGSIDFASLAICNISGLSEKNISIAKNSDRVNVDVSTLDSGVHIVQLYVNGKLEDSKRLLIK